jgi:hypothetical protein
MGVSEDRNSELGTVAVNSVPAELAIGVGHSVSTDPVAAARESVTAALAGELTFGVAAADSIGTDIYGAAKRITEQAWERAGHDAEHSVLLMLSDGLAGDQREVVRGSYAVTGSTVLLVGGTAGENQTMNGTYQFAQAR